MDAVPRPLAEMDDLGRRYAELPAEITGVAGAVSNPSKQDLLLELCHCFHPYLMKYLVMICRGHVPVTGVGKDRNKINKDAAPFLFYFLPKGKKLDRVTAHVIVRHLHLAFKGMTTEEVYGILVEQLIRAINQYDPFYTDKVKRVVEIIENELSKRTQFTDLDVTRYLEFDSRRYIRLLCRHGFLQSFKGERKIVRERKDVYLPRALLQNVSLTADTDCSTGGPRKPCVTVIMTQVAAIPENLLRHFVRGRSRRVSIPNSVPA